MKKTYLYNNKLVFSYHRFLRKLNNLISKGANKRKQEILKKRLANLIASIAQLQGLFKKSALTATAIGGMSILSFNGYAQTFESQLSTKDGLLFGLSKSDSKSTVAFGDLDNDGDLDLLSGNQNGSFNYYQNLGNAQEPSFAAKNANPFGLVSLTDNFSYPSLVDIDNDGDLDIFSGELYGNFIFYKNIGTPTVPLFDEKVENPFGLVSDPFGFSTPTFVDLDNDGDYDILSGNAYGDFVNYQNNGTASIPLFDNATNVFDNLQDVNNPHLLTSRSFCDLDNDGDMDMIEGNYNDGNFYYYPNSGTKTLPNYASTEMNPFGLTNIDMFSRPSFVDLDGDGDSDLFSGSDDGNFYYFKNASLLTGIENSITTTFSVYPNPASDILNIALTEAISGNASITDIHGNVVVSKNVAGSQFNISTADVESGVYLLKVATASLTLTKQVVIVK